MFDKVAIIGAGPSGLCCAKRILEHNLVPVVFDKASRPGGLWIPNRVVWKSMKINSSNFLTSFIDHEWPDDAPIFPNSEQVFDYLMSYVEKYSLDKYFCLNTEVEKITQLDNDEWEIETNNIKTNETKIERFKYLIISTGLNSKPYIPDIKGLEKFMGKIIHSSEYRTESKIYENKRVLVVGNSSSAVEIASDLVDKAKSVTNVFTRPYLIFKKLVKIQDQDENKNEKDCNLIPADFLFFNRNLIYKSADELKNLMANFCPDQLGLNLNTNLKCLKFDIEHEFPRVAVSDNYIDLVKSGKIQAKKSKIEEFDEEFIYFEDESFVQKDIVIFATGFSLGLDFFDQKTLSLLNYQENFEKDPIILYEHTWHPKLKNCAFMGLIRGFYFTGVELQAIYACKVFNGEIKLPEKSVMLEEINKLEKKRIKNEHLNLQYPFGTYVHLIDHLAKLLDLLPDFDKLKRDDPNLYRMMWYNPLMPFHFMLKNDYKRTIKLLNKVDTIQKKKYKISEIDSINVNNYKA